MPTLYDQHKKECDDLARRGYPNTVEMTKIFHRNGEMARALGLAADGSGVSKWLMGRNAPTYENEKRAKNWLAAQAEPEQSDPEPQVANGKPTAPVLMVVCPEGASGKVQKVLAMLGCEVVEI